MLRYQKQAQKNYMQDRQNKCEKLGLKDKVEKRFLQGERVIKIQELQYQTNEVRREQG